MSSQPLQLYQGEEGTERHSEQLSWAVKIVSRTVTMLQQFLFTTPPPPPPPPPPSINSSLSYTFFIYSSFWESQKTKHSCTHAYSSQRPVIHQSFTSNNRTLESTTVGRGILLHPCFTILFKLSNTPPPPPPPPSSSFCASSSDPLYCHCKTVLDSLT